jgi:hypothetical protein
MQNMKAKTHPITLTTEEKEKLEIIARSYQHSARERTRAKILLLTDTTREGGAIKDATIAEMVKCHVVTIGTIREKAAQRGVIPSIEHKEQEKRKARKLDGDAEAKLIAIACSQAPEGRKSWTIKLLTETLIEKQVVETIDEATVCRTLKKIRLNLG